MRKTYHTANVHFLVPTTAFPAFFDPAFPFLRNEQISKDIQQPPSPEFQPAKRVKRYNCSLKNGHDQPKQRSKSYSHHHHHTRRHHHHHHHRHRHTEPTNSPTPPSSLSLPILKDTQHSILRRSSHTGDLRATTLNIRAKNSTVTSHVSEPPTPTQAWSVQEESSTAIHPTLPGLRELKLLDYALPVQSNITSFPEQIHPRPAVLTPVAQPLAALASMPSLLTLIKHKAFLSERIMMDFDRVATYYTMRLKERDDKCRAMGPGSASGGEEVFKELRLCQAIWIHYFPEEQWPFGYLPSNGDAYVG